MALGCCRLSGSHGPSAFETSPLHFNRPPLRRRYPSTSLAASDAEISLTVPTLQRARAEGFFFFFVAAVDLTKRLELLSPDGSLDAHLVGANR